MGIRQIIKGLDGSQQSIGYSAAVPAGLQFINFFGGEIEQGRNLANGGAPAGVVGSPVTGDMSEGVLCTSHTSYIQTAVAQSEKMTVMGVFCPNSDNRAYAVSNATAARPIGFSVYAEPSGTAGIHRLFVQFGGVNASSGVNMSITAAINNAISNNVPFAFAATLDYSALAATKVNIRDLKGGKSATDTRAISSAGSGAAGLIIGSDLDATVRAGTRVLQMAAWNRVLTDDEIAAQYNQIKNYYLNVHGISV